MNLPTTPANDEELFFEGQEFTSFSDLRQQLDTFQRTHQFSLQRRDSRLFHRPDGSKMSIDQAESCIVYSYLIFFCPHRNTQNESIDNSSGSKKRWVRRSDCTFIIRLKATEEGDKLIVTEFVGDHNHAVVKVESIASTTFKCHLSADEKEELNVILMVEPSIKKAMTHASLVTHKELTMNYLTNLKQYITKRKDRSVSREVRLRCMRKLCEKLTNVVVDMEQDQFLDTFKALNDMTQMLKEGEGFELIKVDDEDCNASKYSRTEAVEMSLPAQAYNNSTIQVDPSIPVVYVSDQSQTSGPHVTIPNYNYM